MTTITRREFLQVAAATGASAAWGRVLPARSRTQWREQRDLYPEGVASGDPRPDGVILWTRHPGTDAAIPLTVEISEDVSFKRVVATAKAVARKDNDWTVRVMVGRLSPSREYFYRFTDASGAGSRIGRTRTAPADGDAREVRFAFVSCQDPSTGALNAWRRMIHEDEQADAAHRLDFVLHLGDFVYEVVWYPEDRATYYGRTIRSVVRYPTGQKIRDLHVPVDVEDYRALYKGYLHDPDLQDARARFPFVCMWDNHEFSWNGWQAQENYGNGNFPAQTRKVAAMQAWWEFQPSRVTKSGASLEMFDGPKVADAPIARFDEHGMGQEPNNLAALASLTGYRAMRFGQHLELIITDQRSYRSEDPLSRPEAAALSNADFPRFMPEEAQRILDAGRDYNGGHPPATIRVGDREIPNFRKDEPPQTILGATQKAWFLARLKESRATWKVWGNTTGVLDQRTDLQHLPPGNAPKWPVAGYAGMGGGDHGCAYHERAQLYDFVARERITGFACVAGDRHSFWAGLMAKSLPPDPFEPVGVAFITGSISSAGLAEWAEYNIAKTNPLRALYLADRAGSATPEITMNVLLRHGVKACLEYAMSGDAAKARALSNPDVAPHLAFLDEGGHGYAVVRASADHLDCEFVCIPRPVARATTSDGGPLRYRIVQRARAWSAGERPRLERTLLTGETRIDV